MNTAVRQAILSTSPIVVSPNALYPAITSWTGFNASISADGIISEDSLNSSHSAFRSAGSPPLTNGKRYRWTVWMRPLNRRFCYLTIAPENGNSRFVTVWGLDGQGLLDTKQIGTSIAEVTTSYRRIQQGISRLVFEFLLVNGGANSVPIIGVVNAFPPFYSGSFDPQYVGLNMPSIQHIANELIQLN